MTTITIDIPDDDAQLLERELPEICDGEFNSHGTLDVPKLAKMLLEDAALAFRRPGSWEGSNMIQVLSSHGYEL